MQLLEIEGRRYIGWEETYQLRTGARVEVYLGADIKHEAERYAAAVEVPLGQFIRNILREYMNTRPKGGPEGRGSVD